MLSSSEGVRLAEPREGDTLTSAVLVGAFGPVRVSPVALFEKDLEISLDFVCIVSESDGDGLLLLDPSSTESDSDILGDPEVD